MTIATKQITPDPVVVQRQNDLFDLYNNWPGDGDPDDDPEFVDRAREIMGLAPLGEAVRAAFNPHEPRIPGGEHGGEWTIVGAVKHIAEAIASGEEHAKPAKAGDMGDVRIVTHKNGTRTVHKVLTDVSDTMGSDEGDPVRQADAEQLGGNLGHLLGAPVPRVHRTSDHEIWMDQVDGEDLGEVEERIRDSSGGVAAFHDMKQTYADLAATDEGFRLGVFDLLSGNWDRNKYSNTVVTPDGTPAGIDHSFLWDDVDPDPANPPKGSALSPFAEIFTSKAPDGTRAWVDNPLTPADVDWLRARLAAVEGDFDAAGRHDWWQFAADRLEAIAPHATGTHSRLAT